MIRRTAVIAGLVAVLLAAAPATVMAVHGATPGALELTPRLRDLVRREMQAIRAAAHDILDALATGDLATAAERAQDIHDSFILERSLTEQDREDLAAGAPPRFLELDRVFHRNAGNLAVAARNENEQLAQYFFARLTEGCVECHNRFATERFPGFRHPIE